MFLHIFSQTNLNKNALDHSEPICILCVFDLRHPCSVLQFNFCKHPENPLMYISGWTLDLSAPKWLYLKAVTAFIGGISKAESPNHQVPCGVFLSLASSAVQGSCWTPGLVQQLSARPLPSTSSGNSKLLCTPSCLSGLLCVIKKPQSISFFPSWKQCIPVSSSIPSLQRFERWHLVFTSEVSLPCLFSCLATINSDSWLLGTTNSFLFVCFFF